MQITSYLYMYMYFYCLPTRIISSRYMHIHIMSYVNTHVHYIDRGSRSVGRQIALHGALRGCQVAADTFLIRSRGIPYKVPSETRHVLRLDQSEAKRLRSVTSVER